MKNLDFIAEELFNKIRGRFPSITIGDAEGKVTDQPSLARFFDFQYKQGGASLGSVSVTLTDEAVQVMYNTDFVANEDGMTRDTWYSFLKELRVFAKKRLLNFDTRNIQKSNLDKRDYQFLAKQRTGDEQMTEAKLYGTSRKSYQDIGKARVTIEHHTAVNQELAAGRTQHISKLYIESSEGERFKYPFKHLNGARAMARHVSEGGKPFDDFGKHITGLSEELASLRKFKTYMSRSAVMAEGLGEYTSVVIERIEEIKKRCENLQRETRYNEAFESFEASVLEEVPSDVSENWIDQLTIRQFNEELKDVFPYIYKLISEKSVAKDITPEDLLDEAPVDDLEVGLPADTYKVQKGDTLYSIYMKFKYDNFQNHDRDTAIQAIMDENPDITDPSMIKPGMVIKMPYFMGSGPSGSTRGLPPGGFEKYESEIESAFEEMMGQFSEAQDVEMCPEACCGKPVTECACGPDCKHCDCYEKNKMNEEEAEGNAFTQALAKAKANNDDEMEVDGKKIPVTEFILSMYDRENGQFPKGETAVLTAVEKDYGEQYINPAKAFIEAVNAKFEEFNGYRDPDLDMVEHDSEKTDIGNYFTKSNPEVLKKQKSFLAMTNELASREDIPKEEFIGAIQQFIKPSHDDGDYLKFASRALTRMITVMRLKNDPRWREWNPIVREYQKRVLDRAIKRAYDPDQNDPRNEQNDLDNLIKTGVSGSYEFIAKTIKDFEELIKNNPNHPKVPQVKAELAKLKPQLAQARKDSGMEETTMDEDLSQNYASDAEAIQALMAKGARSTEETQYLTMLARKYDFYGKPENIPAAIEKAKKAAAKQPGGVDGQGAKMSRDGGAGNTKPYKPKDFPSMAAAMAKVDYYEPGGRITIDGKPYVRDVDEKGNKFFRPDTRKPAQPSSRLDTKGQTPTRTAPTQGQPTSRLDTKGQTPSAESVELNRIKGLAGL